MNKNNRSSFWILTIIGFTILVALLFLNGEHWLREFLLYLSGAVWARQLVTGLPLARRVASRFVAGETSADAMRAGRELNEAGFRVSLDFLGESVTTAAEAEAARDEILALLDEIAAAGLDANVSVKPSQLGLNIDPDLVYANIQAIVQAAAKYDNWIRLDMEDSNAVDRTLALYRQLRFAEGLDNVGVVIQSYLYRSEADVAELSAVGARVRLCKGAYAEPPERAFPHKDDTDANFARLMRMMLAPNSLEQGTWLALATHDERLIEAAIHFLKDHELPPSTIEFQMLYGIRRELQQSLLASGYPVRIYVPYGRAWYPYFVRRLAERPANLWFFISNYFQN
jgi:proline dehydrogenase